MTYDKKYRVQTDGCMTPGGVKWPSGKPYSCRTTEVPDHGMPNLRGPTCTREFFTHYSNEWNRLELTV